MADRITDGREGLNPLFNRPRGRAEKVSFDLLKSQRRPAFLDREQPTASTGGGTPAIRPRVGRLVYQRYSAMGRQCSMKPSAMQR